MQSLLWKEWHEQRWKLAFGSLILAAFALIGLRSRVVADELLLGWVCFLAVVLLPVLASTGLVPAERSDGTLESLLSLPVEPRRIFLVKTFMGVLLTAVPLLVAAAVSLVLAGGREMSSFAMLSLFARTLAASLSLFFWMFALTVRLPTETRALLITMAVLIMWMLVTLGILELPGDQRMHSAFWVISPFVFLVSAEDGLGRVQLLAVLGQGAIALVLWFWAVRQFAQPDAAPAEGRS